MSEPIRLDHLFLNDTSRALIAKACAGGKVVYLSPLDKGLSGSSVWLARWVFRFNQISKHHVFKIGPLVKLRREREATKSIASVLIRHFPHVELFEDDRLSDKPKKRTALLRQEFMGNVEGRAVNLRRFVQISRSTAVIERVLRKLYEETMAAWHEIPTTSASTQDSLEKQPLATALNWWISRTDLGQAADEIGRSALEKQLRERFKTTLMKVEDQVGRLGAKIELIRVGPVHGDLHAENVLVDEGNNINIIDYGWTSLDKWRAIDFLMMECSLKFVVSPPHAAMDDLLRLEQVLDESWTEKRPKSMRQLTQVLNGQALVKIAGAIGYVRRRALACEAVESADQYRRGLILLTAGLSSLPKQINRAFLFQSLCYHLQKVT